MSTVTGVLSNIGPFVPVPEHIRKAPISKTALAVWMELASHSSPLKPTVFAIQDAIALAISRSTRAVRTALKQLIAGGLIKEIGYYQGRFKRYSLAWTNFFTNDGQKLLPTLEESFRGPRKDPSADPGRKVPTDQSIRKEDLEKNTDDLESLITKHEKEWTSNFSSLDGKSGRPSLRECIQQALCHKSRHSYTNLKVYLDMWLRTASQKWPKPDIQAHSGVQKTRELLEKWDEAFNSRTEIPEALWEHLRAAAGIARVETDRQVQAVTAR